MILVGNQQVALPEGVTALDWSLERVNAQNPRIRSYLGCIRLIEGVLESNYALLHCSPERLLDIWGKVRQVASLIRTQLSPLLETPSRIPRLEEARQSAGMALLMLERSRAARPRPLPGRGARGQLMEVRKLLCVSIGQIHSFLHDTFGEVMASDPRSLHDADYFLSRRFPRDIDEAEWLHSTLVRLGEYLAASRTPATATSPRSPRRSGATRRCPRSLAWEPTADFLEVLLNGLTPKLKEVLALRGVRFYEMEILDRHAFEIPHRCRAVLDLHATALEAVEGIKAAVGASPGGAGAGGARPHLVPRRLRPPDRPPALRDRHRGARPRRLRPALDRGGGETARPAAAQEPRGGRPATRRVVAVPWRKTSPAEHRVIGSPGRCPRQPRQIPCGGTQPEMKAMKTLRSYIRGNWHEATSGLRAAGGSLDRGDDRPGVERRDRFRGGARLRPRDAAARRCGR